MNTKDRERLRYLAAHQLEIANSPKNLERVELWKRHNMYKGERPPIHIEVGTFAHEAITPFLQCEDEASRNIEYKLSAILSTLSSLMTTRLYRHIFSRPMIFTSLFSVIT